MHLRLNPRSGTQFRDGLTGSIYGPVSDFYRLPGRGVAALPGLDERPIRMQWNGGGT